MREIDLKRTVLKNGLRIISVKKDSDIFSAAAGIKAGSLYEDAEISGISHMVEHMLFKGTSSRDMKTINADMEKLAGDLDIYTTYHQTVMNISVMKSRGRDCIELISDILMNSVFPVKEYNLEKRVIAEEIKMEKDDPEEMSYLGLYKAACPGTWHKYHITGSIKSVKSIKRHQIVQYYKDYYIPQNCAVCIVSSYGHDDVVKLADQYFGGWQSGIPIHVSKSRDPMLPGSVTGHKKGIGQAHVLYGFDIQGLSRREEIALILLDRKIGSGPNSILFRELRDNNGYAYNVYSDMDLVQGMKMYYIYAAVSEENVRDATSIIDDVISGFSQKRCLVDEEWMSLVKDNFLTDTSVAMESPTHMADYLLDGELNYNNPMEYRNVLSLMEDIHTDDICGVGAKVLKNPIVHILYPR